MFHSRRPKTPDGDGHEQEPQGSRSLTAPNERYQSFDFDNFSPERVGPPMMPLQFNTQPPGAEHHALPPHQRASFLAPSINDDPWVPDDILGPPRHDTFDIGYPVTSPARHDNLSVPADIFAAGQHNGIHTNDTVTTPARTHDKSYETDEFHSPSSKPEEEEVYRDVLPGEITPYVGLRARLTQIPINRWTVLLLLVLARLIILFESLNTSLTGAKQEAASACAKVEEMGSAMASMPHYLSVGVNELLAKRITDTIRTLIWVINMILSTMLSLLMFVIERTYGTIVCVADTFVHALITLAEEAVQVLIEGIDAALKDATGEIVQALNGIRGLLNTFNIPAGNLDTAIAALTNANFLDDTGILQSISDFDKEVPTFDEIIADVQAVVGLPFTTVQTLLNESYGNWTMDSAIFPTPSEEALTFCTGNDSIKQFFDVLFIVAKSAKIIAIAGLLIATLLAAAFMLWLEVQRYRKTTIKSRVLQDRKPLDSMYIIGRPLTASTGLWISEKVTKDPDRQMLVRWVVAYATTYTALFVLALAVGGFFSVLCQYFIMRAIQKETPGLSQEVGIFVANAIDAIDGSSMGWANGSNQAMLNLENDLNDNVFVYIQNATGSVVNLINEFESQTTTFLDKFFGNTAIGQSTENFVEGLLDCVIFNALNKTRDGIEWINAESHITFPRFPADMFSMGATKGGNTSFATMLTNAGNQTATEVTAALNKIVIELQSGVIQGGLISFVLLMVYCLYVLLAVAQAAMRMTCLRERKSLDDAERQAGAVKKPGRTGANIEGGSSWTRRRPSVAPSYRLSNLDVTQLACDLSVAVPDTRTPAGRRSASVRSEGHGVYEQPQQQHAAVEDPFGDDTYAIGDDEVDGIVHRLRRSGELAENSAEQSSFSFGQDTHTIGDEEVDGIAGALRASADGVLDTSRPRNRHAWMEGVNESK